MTAALAAALGAAVVAIVALAILVRARSKSAGDERRRADEATRDLGDALDRAAEASRRAEAGERAATDQAASAAAAVSQAEQSQRRAEEAERRAEDADQRVEAACRALLAAPDDVWWSVALWDLEQVRAEREWADLVGPDVALPVDWEPTVAAVVAIELELIKEVIGTPAVMETRGDEAGQAPASPLAARMSAELVRRLARAGEEMTVTVGAGEITVSHLAPGDDLPDLTSLAKAASEGGGRLETSSTAGRVTVRLRYP